MTRSPGLCVSQKLTLPSDLKGVSTGFAPERGQAAVVVVRFGFALTVLETPLRCLLISVASKDGSALIALVLRPLRSVSAPWLPL